MEGKGKIVFVTGTDTGVGKSVVTGVLARDMRKGGIDAITVKLVQTGNDGFSEDIELHRKLMGGVEFEEDRLGLTAPQIFKFPSSALLAAQLEGREVDVGRIVASVEECARRREVVLVEGAGGLFVPLTDDLAAIDLVQREGWPVVLVCNGRLGSINHTLLSIDALRSRSIPLERVVYNWAPDVDPVIDRDTPATIERYLKKWGFDGVDVARFEKVEKSQVPTASRK